ncbi:GNAT family N-acetyltransferase [Psychromonas sp. psych-6C06]|uniref:GNAT family N-acetyltransferase n=1 Tax=Psychromonas sp. psych-6C06 TaxID=2058089 RepID=UPI000C349EA9|nr:GNAT family N-acetyltransferase [Psychromonas sp. psych-6C06]PKF60804.1 GNAT family N-acetyltransferase [Psychromonas sp. psych-6C06]
MTINIKRCTVSQLNLLREVSIETYRDTFAESNSEQFMQQYLSDALNEKKLSAELNNINSEFYFIHFEDQVAGFLKVNVGEGQTDDVEPNSLEVERFYIRQAFLRKGLGKVLMQFACELTKQHDKNSLWLGVWEGNYSALAFYKAQGFYQIGEHPFDMGGDIQTDLLFKKDLLD